MKCSQCGTITSIVDSRPHHHGAIVKRRRGCDGCGARFTTYEVHKDLYRRLEMHNSGENSDRDMLLVSLQALHDKLGQVIKKRKAA